MEVRLVAPAEKDAWNSFVASAPTGHVVQSWEWGDFKAGYGNPVTRVGVFEGNKLVAAAAYTLHSLPYTGKMVGYLPKGPVVASPDPEILKLLLEELPAIAQKQKVIFIRLEPNFLSDTKYQIPDTRYLTQAPKNIFAPHTLLLDLTKSEEELLQSMHEKWRYNIRLSERKGVQVAETEEIETFIKIQRETASRDKFFIHPDRYYRGLWERLHPAGEAHLLQASHEGDTLVSWLLFRFGDTLYYPYGASRSEKRNLMPSHAMMWEAIKLGKKLGCKTFDLWGAAPEEAPDSDPWQGFTRFKLGFGAQRVSFVGTFDLVITPTWYKLFNLADNLRWKLLRLVR